MTEPVDAITSTQRGAIGELVLAARVILATNGRLSPYQPVADDRGIDVLMHDGMTGRSAPIQLKTRTKPMDKSPNLVQFTIRKKTLASGANSFLLALLFAPNGYDVRCAWLLPIRDIPLIANEKQEVWALNPSLSKSSQDKYTPYRCHTLEEVGGRLLDYFDQQAG